MNGARSRSALAPRRVPDAYLRAEVAAFPLASVEAFHLAVVALDPALESGRGALADGDGPTLRLWRACDRELAGHASGSSLDRLIALRDLTWFGASRDRPPVRRDDGLVTEVPMHEYLALLARTHIEVLHGTSELRYGTGTSASDALNRYRWLNFALPEDLLLAALPIVPQPTGVAIQHPLVERRLLDLGAAEIHQHINAGLDFPFLWESALAAVADPRVRGEDLTSPGMPFHYRSYAPMDSFGAHATATGERLLRWLLVAALARVVLLEFLCSLERAHAVAGDELAFGEWQRSWRGREGLEPHDRLTLRAALHALTRRPWDDPPPLARLRHLYGKLHPEARAIAREPPRTVDEVRRRCDPIAVRLGLAAPGGGERWLMRHGLQYLRAHHDVELARLFWQALRIRCIYYRYIVERPLTAGLQWFIRFFDRIGPLCRPLERVKPEAAYRVAGERQRVGALELRMRGESSASGEAAYLSSLLASWQNVLDAYEPGNEPELGVVLEFVKNRDATEAWKHGRPRAFGRGTYAEPDAIQKGCAVALEPGGGRLRFADYLRRQAALSEAAGRLLCAVPLSLWLVRGIDVCSDELSVPTWVLVPLYEHVRREAAYASRLPDARNAPMLGITAHVGEDFRHLMEGLRRMYEAVHYLLGSRGGRLGHGTALGVDPQLWGESVGAVLMPTEERLWDLVLEWRLYAGFEVGIDFVAQPPPGRQLWLDDQLRELGRALFGVACEPRELAQLHHELHAFMLPPRPASVGPTGFDVVRALRRYCGSSPSTTQTKRLLSSYLGDRRTFRRGQELVDVTIGAEEVAALSAVQDALRRGVAARGIVVEVNPTSNLLIGDMLDLRHHPVLRLFPLELEGAPPPVPIAIGSDDPITFSTSLVREYGLLYHAARGAGYADRTVSDWLARIRQVSMDARFTVAWKPTAYQFCDELRRALDAYLQRPAEVRVSRRWRERRRPCGR